MEALGGACVSSVGLSSHDLYRHGLYSYYLHSYGRWPEDLGGTYLSSDDPHGYGLAWLYVVMAYIIMAYIDMTHMVKGLLGYGPA